MVTSVNVPAVRTSTIAMIREEKNDDRVRVLVTASIVTGFLVSGGAFILQILDRLFG